MVCLKSRLYSNRLFVYSWDQDADCALFTTGFFPSFPDGEPCFQLLRTMFLATKNRCLQRFLQVVHQRTYCKAELVILDEIDTRFSKKKKEWWWWCGGVMTRKKQQSRDYFAMKCHHGSTFVTFVGVVDISLDIACYKMKNSVFPSLIPPRLLIGTLKPCLIATLPCYAWNSFTARSSACSRH